MSTKLTAAVVAVSLAIVPLAGHADPSWHAGLNLRIDASAHPIRTGGGIETGAFDVTLVLDPMFWTDGQHDLDLFAAWSPRCKRISVLGGWRTTVIGLDGGNQLQDKLLVGMGAPLPRFGPIRWRWNLELATVVVKHGGDLPTSWISFATGRDFVDLLNFGMFVTVEYASR